MSQVGKPHGEGRACSQNLAPAWITFLAIQGLLCSRILQDEETAPGTRKVMELAVVLQIWQLPCITEHLDAIWMKWSYVGLSTFKKQ